jgi:predicted phosphoserine aminotransferase
MGILGKLKKVFETERDVIVWTSSGSLVMEASLRNSVKKGALHTLCGSFAERWYKMSQANGLPNGKIDVEWGMAIKPDLVDKELATGKYDVLCLTHNETSTGVMNPTAEIADMVKAKYPDVLILVDAVSSMTGAKIDVHKYDVVLTSSQKCFGLPPGLAFCVVSPRFMDNAKTVPNRGLYTDFVDMKKYIVEKEGQTPSTPALSLYNALDFQLDRMLSEGMDARYKRHAAMAERTREWVKKHFALFPEPGYESLTVTVGSNNKNANIGDLNKALGQKGMAIANGYGKLKDLTFRIAHMGDLQMKDIDELLSAIDEILGH